MEVGFNIGVIACCLLLLFYCIFLEVKRKDKHWLLGRILANVLLIGSLTLMIIPIFYEHKETQAKNTLTVVTAGANLDSISKIETPLYYTDLSLREQIGGKANYLPDLAYYLAENPEISLLQVFGYGLASTDLKKLNDIPIDLHPAPIPSGILNCNWNGDLKQEQLLTIQGSYQNNSAKTIQLKLMGFGHTLDSVEIKPNRPNDFTLKHQVRQHGKSVLTLVGLAEKDTVAKEQIPINVGPKTPISMLMFTSFPSFEYKFLKQWLYEKQYPVAYRSSISKDKFSTDFLNRDRVNLSQMSAAQLKKEDVLLVDGHEFENSAASTKRNWLQAVSQGLGLIVWLDDPQANSSLLKKVKQIEHLKNDGVQQLTILTQQQRLPTLKTALKWHLIAQGSQQSLIRNQRGETIALEVLYGSGKIIYTSLSDSYQWLLNGEKEAYANYWTTLINAAARTQEAALSLSYSESFPKVAEKLRLTITLNETRIPNFSYENKYLTVNQNLVFPNRWEATLWPQKAGWQTLVVNQTNKSVYIYEKQAWLSVRLAQILQDNLAYSRKTSAKLGKHAKKEIRSRQPVSKWYFLIALVFAASFLWFEKKYYAKS